MTALFTKKPKSERVKKEKVEVKPLKEFSRAGSYVLLRPRITEKATLSSEKGVYVFEVDIRAGKKEIINTIVSIYKTKPSKVRIVRTPGKVRFVRGKWGKTNAEKKAYVYFPKGTKIEVM